MLPARRIAQDRRSTVEDPCVTALRAGGVQLAFQPIVRARAPHRVGFFEGLSRLRVEGGEVTTPARFLPPIEAAGQIALLDRHALRRGLDALAEHPHMRLTLNAGAPTLTDEAWLSLLRREAADRPHLTDRLVVEITETAVADIDAAVRFTRTVRRLGVTVVLDDFGAGATAFRHFRDLALDGVKIDGLFSREVDRNRDHQALMRALTKLARHFDLFTVAEYVETRAEAAWLARIGVDFLQGYLFAPPGPRPDWRIEP
ncbi:EAL domain-containing protein [Roseobacter sp. HKCCA0434]|uniref:EAL domain-containing protein n=1 Tax=Roseobacter sp. HKCCA0434 TaxID=3079297 RepID=UPI002905BF5A|nr:EAL domain-containing protein [Roseobacter sp. HKCCA0434]